MPAALQVRHVGLSNETPYGLMRFCHLGEPLPATASCGVPGTFAAEALTGIHVAHAPQNVSLPPCPPSPTPHAAASRPDLPDIASLQNAYSLLCRTFDAGLAECCHAERVSLLAYSPLAMVRRGGALSAGLRCLAGLAGARSLCSLLSSRLRTHGGHTSFLMFPLCRACSPASTLPQAAARRRPGEACWWHEHPAARMLNCRPAFSSLAPLR